MTISDAWDRRTKLTITTPKPNGRIRLDVARHISRVLDAVTGTRPGESLFWVDRGWWRASLSPYLTELLDLGLTPTRILDVGCGEGLAACCYAGLNPTAQVVGVDYCGRCVANARTIAHRLDLKNVHIIEAEVADLPAILPTHRFDVVLARSVLGRCLCGRSDATTSVSWNEKVAAALPPIQRLLTDDGVFISTESCWETADLWYRASAITSAGFTIDWTRSRGAITTLWNRPVTRSPMLVARLSDGPASVYLSDVLGLLVGMDFQTSPQIPALTGFVAEAMFQSLKIDGLIFGSQASRIGAVLRRDLYRVGAMLVSYDQDERHHRELSLWPLRGADHIRAQLEKEADDLETQGWTISKFLPAPYEDDSTGVQETA